MISFTEIFDMVMMTAFVGFIFSDIFKRFQAREVLDYLKPGFDWDSFKFAALVTAPGLILHELAHKFVAMGFGMQATFHAAYVWLVIGLLLKLLNFGFIIFVPAFVSILGSGTNLQFAVIAFAGPAMNLLLWLGTDFAFKKGMIKPKQQRVAFLTREINKFLFIFNMIPLPMFDGFKVFSNLIKVIF
ncbi:hypothetical protein KY320_02325 [Candidatus Woesearchaeota archaeon]|nr:hypothetical protein [Candidatus Woesearchaeota archaeon]